MSELAGVYRSGTAGQPVLVLLHSSQSNSGQWRALQTQLQAEYDIIAIDLLGYGQAPAVATGVEPEAFRFSDEMPRVIEALQHYQITQPVTLIGHSYGGALALKLALEQPFVVDRVVLFEPVAFHVLDHQDPARAEIDAIAAQMDQYDAQAATRNFVDYWNEPGYFDALPDKIKRLMVAQASKVAMDFSALMGEPHKLQDYRHVQQPLLLLQGASTQASAKQVAQQLLHVLPHATTVTLPCGHMGPLTHAALVNQQIIEFLQQTS
ncbi:MULTISPECIES: alpha/beta fold hydrolase [Pseudidiomarina]|uniref:Pimeloyl-ACP methyl ester carboxylesterase n=2 Tax=Pseudidiomarina TaxID=2800384 RepID=A0A368VAI3_9GAMM|nr:MULTISPECIES: alpha/beta hydrolase [Pseudidiomarina]PWW15959.1 pimeloyl-ACP methyl ester carboxylesterase [Pseudidiomarina maritima]RBP93531.1 pimeloyl-ACP methyl ester carboxylesterase [Pseudidiomarina tainanensis]RCW35991.1 pimeloyl-ACP methyl ester carboxylesterase [Pseudidiomarina tainanensis]